MNTARKTLPCGAKMTAGVEPENLAFCLEALLAEPPFQGAQPKILREPGDALLLSYLEVTDDGRSDD